MKRYLAIILSVALIISMFPMKAEADSEPLGVGETLRFDFGGAEVEEGYIGVSSGDAYTAEAGYGFENTDAVENVTASGEGALKDAVRFKSGVPGHVFHVDLPSGVYKITVTTGDVQSTTINAEGLPQLFFLTGNNAVDTFTIPVTDGQLNIYAGSGVGTEFSISALEIQRTSTGTTTKPTIWTCGDSTVASYYNVPADAKRGWGQYLSNYVDMEQYDIRNISASGITSRELKDYFFPTAEYYGKSGDIMLIAVGLNDYSQQYNGDSSVLDPSEYIANVTNMVQRAKAKGMTVYLVKQNGQLDDCTKYPVLTSKWFGEELETIAATENVGIIDLFEPWLVFCMENTVRVAGKYYSDDKLHMNALGADMLAGMVKEQLFPAAKPAPGEDPYKNFDTSSTVYYEAEASGEPVVNPHKGYVMTVYDAWAFESTNPYGIGGSMNNTAWEMSTICTGEPKWDELNPEEGVYDWSSIDSMLEACEKYGYTYGIRILPYSHLSGSHANYGKDHVFVPDWVFAKGAQMDRATLYSDPSVELDIPKWDDPIFLQAAKDFADALAEHYDGDPRVEFIDISVFGNWGEWHTTTFEGNPMPSVEIQKDMVKYYSDAFDKTWLCVTSGAYGEVYDYALSLGIPKRVNGLIGSHNYEWNLRPNYKANLPVIGENFLPYRMMFDPTVAEEQGIVKDYDKHYLRWTPQRFRETIEISHLSIYAFDQDSHHSYEFYNEQKDLIEEMNNRLGYNYTVTSAKRNGNKLLVSIKNTGLAPAFFDIDLCAEITDAEGNKLGTFGNPVKIAKGSFRDDTEQTFLFEYDGTLAEDVVLCLAMYESDKLPATKSKARATVQDPTVKFDNKNTLSNNRLLMVVDESMHTHAGTLVEQRNATCTEFGVKAYYECACGKFFVDSACSEEIADLDAWKTGEGRIWKEAHTGGNATCKEKAKCAVCGTEYGELADHEYGANWKSDETNHWQECAVCENEKNRAGHVDADKDGKCEVCGEDVASEEAEPTAAPPQAPIEAPTEAPPQAPIEAPTEVPIVTPTVVPTEAPATVPTEAPKVPTTTEEPVPTSQPIVPNAPKTGDDFNPWLFGGIGIAAMLAGVGTFFRRKKKEAC
ncbi:MAG: LPXTG cell wall anchor domain-containing protein [Lachnospiraceae bacterium]|nr:LPXTG cell wall anchor domain-containing protein [Lachnospiraceae bacterium]